MCVKKNKYTISYEKAVKFIEDSVINSRFADNESEFIDKCRNLDPDGESIRIHGCECTADGLLSIQKMFDKYGFSPELIEEYREYRKTPIFHFPRVQGGINQTRALATTFRDKIDYTLFDLQNYCNGKTDCKLKKAYELPKTKAWLESFDMDFKKIIDWFNVKGIFTDDNYKVFDLEYDDRKKTINKYSELYGYEWSDNYYENVKKKIKEFEARLEEEH